MAVKILYITLTVLLLNLVVAVHTAQWASLCPVIASIVGVCVWIRFQQRSHAQQ